MVEPIATSSTSPRKRRVVLMSLLIVAHALFCVLFQPFDEGEKPRLLVMGAVFLQPVLFATWAVLGPPPVARRLPLTLAAFAAIVLCGATTNREWLAPDYLMIAAGFFSVTTIVMLIAAGVFRLRIENVVAIAESGATVNQFSLRFLIGFTTACALLLGLGRGLASPSQWSQHPNWATFVAELLAPLGIMMLITLPSIFVPLLVLSQRPSRSLLLILAFAWLVLSWLAIETIASYASLGESRVELTLDIALIQLGAFLVGTLSAIVVRFAGYRLVKCPSRRQPVAATI